MRGGNVYFSIRESEGYVTKCKQNWVLESEVIEIFSNFSTINIYGICTSFRKMVKKQTNKQKPQCLPFLPVESGPYIHDFSAGRRKTSHKTRPICEEFSKCALWTVRKSQNITNLLPLNLFLYISFSRKPEPWQGLQWWGESRAAVLFLCGTAEQSLKHSIQIQTQTSARICKLLFFVIRFLPVTWRKYYWS